MFKIAIVEDEEFYVKQLQEYLVQYEQEQGEKFSITVYRDGDGVINEYKAQFDLILMDIQMRFVDGMSAAEEIRKVDSEVVIIFITNMTQYAIRGYQVDALDYVLKPINYYMLKQRLDKAIERIKNRKTCYLTLAVKGGIQKIDIGNLLYVESQRHMLFYHMKKEIITTRGNIQEVEAILVQHDFFRSNKGYLVNLQYVDTVQDNCCVIAKESLPIARARKKQFMEALTKHIGEVMG